MKREKILALCVAAALLLPVAGCGGAGGDRPAASGNAAMQESGTQADSAMPSAPEAMGGGSEVYRNTDAKLIRRAELAIQTETFDQAAQALSQLTEECGGYFEQASVYGGSLRNTQASRSGEYIVRIPAEQYEHFLTQAGSLGYVTRSTESTEDVGEQYYDTEARLRTQKTKQERLLALLEQADTMEAIVALESALSDTEYQIEQLTSTLNRYDALIGYATFRISLEEVARITEQVGQSAALGQRIWAGLKASLSGLLQGGQDLLVWVSYHFFALILAAAAITGVGLLAARRVKRRGRPSAERSDRESSGK